MNKKLREYKINNYNLSINDIIKRRFFEKVYCPHCKSFEVVKFGKYKERQRYKCKCCGRTFNDLTGTLFSGTHYLHLWGSFAECMSQSMPLRAAADILKIKHTTLFYWRHKILEAHCQIKADNYSGIVEIENRQLNYVDKSPAEHSSVNGKVVNLTVYYERNNIYQAASFCNWDKKINIFKDIFLDKINPHSTILLRNNKPFYLLFKSFGYNVISLIKKKNMRNKLYTTEKIKYFSNSFFKWLKVFKGVSSKFLLKYAAWFIHLNKFNFENSKTAAEDLVLSTLNITCNFSYKNCCISKLSNYNDLLL